MASIVRQGLIAFPPTLIASAVNLMLLASAVSAPLVDQSCTLEPKFGFAEPQAEGFSTQKLLALTRWIRDAPVPIFSIAISRHGKVVFELTTGQSRRDQAHYLMSITKSVTSALVGAAFDRHLLADPAQTVSDALPRSVFRNETIFAQFKRVTIRDVLGMSALDAQCSLIRFRLVRKKRAIATDD
jgi:CubicO group peptidase (beta-lactamase class C family)